MNKEEKENLIKMHVELLAVAKVIVDEVIVKPDEYWQTVRSVYDKLFAMEMHKINLQVQKGMMKKVPDVNAMIGKILGGGKE